MKRILAWTCLAFLAAETAAAFLGKSVILMVLGAIAAFALLARRRNRASFCLILAVAALLGSLWSVCYTEQHLKAAQKLDGKTVTATAEVKTLVPAYGKTAYGTLLLSEINGQNQKALVSCYGFPSVEPGQRFQASFALTQVAGNKLSQYADGIFLTAEYQGEFVPMEPGTGLLSRFAQSRMGLSNALMSVMDPEKGALVCAMALGDKSRLTGSLRGTFSSAGASHMLVVSGMHLAMLCGLLAGAFHLNAFSRKRAILLALISLVVSALVGFTVSVVRAATVMLLSCIGICEVRKTDTLTSLSFAAFLICCHSPYAMFDVGFQLTFGATVGVVAANKIYYDTATPHKEGENEQKKLRKGLKRTRDAVLTALLMGLFASLFTAPFLLWHRMAVSGVSMFSSVLAMVLLPMILLLGGISAMVSLLGLSRLAGLLVVPLQFLLDVLLNSLKALGSLPIARLSLPREYTIFALLVIALWAALMVKWNRTGHLPGRLALLLLAACLIGTAFGRNVIEIEEFGNASAPCILVTQNGQTLLVYRGGQANRAQLQKILDYRGLAQPGLVIDIRQSGTSEPPEAERALTANTLNEILVEDFTEDISYCLLPEKKGTIVLLDVGGYRAAMTAGELKEHRQVPVDIYFAAGRNAYQIQADKTIISHIYPWLGDSPENIWYGTNPVIAIRPGKSILYKGVKRLAVQ